MSDTSRFASMEDSSRIIDACIKAIPNADEKISLGATTHLDHGSESREQLVEYANKKLNSAGYTDWEAEWVETEYTSIRKTGTRFTLFAKKQ